MSRDVGVSELLALLQSSDLKELEQVKSTISEQLNTGYSPVLVCLAVLLAVFFAKTVLFFVFYSTTMLVRHGRIPRSDPSFFVFVVLKG